MENPLAIAVRDSQSPDELHEHFFRYFQGLFLLHPKSNVRGTSVLSHDFPDALFRTPSMLGLALAGALMAMLNHEMDLGPGAPFVAVTPEHFKILDEIILEQAAIAGGILNTSHLVLSRTLEWERKDDRKYTRWLKALGKAQRVHQRKMAAPITDRSEPEAKRIAVEQLRPMWTRLREKFAKQHRLPNPKQVRAAFEEEITSPDAPQFVGIAHNRQLWLRWLDSKHDDLVKIALTYSVEKVYDSYVAFVRGYSNPDYARKKISSLKKSASAK
ncbi:MAG: hypothetical protein WA830_25460 [Candidatus Sulfotelmatobacter sp.]